MLPFENRPWARPVATLIIVLTLIAAVVAPIVLHQRKALDVPIVVGIVLLVLAIVPPNIMVLRHRRAGDDRQTATMVPSRPSIR